MLPAPARRVHGFARSLVKPPHLGTPVPTRLFLIPALT